MKFIFTFALPFQNNGTFFKNIDLIFLEKD